MTSPGASTVSTAWTDFDRFSCESYDIDWSSGELTLRYALLGARRLEFTERVRLPLPEGGPSDERRADVASVLPLLHAVAGVSYFKAAAPRTVTVASAALTAAELRFVQQAYTAGMYEFAVRNALPRILETKVDASAAEPAGARHHGTDAPLVPCGGGKDSIVSLELVGSRGLAPTAFAVNPNAAIRDVVAASGRPLLAASRAIDPALFDANARGALNGHVPVTAINSIIAVATALLHGLGPVVMSNEASASIPNLRWRSVDVNHQWSKSLEAERLLQDALRSRTGFDWLYFSLLRPFNELQIARRFAGYTAYDDVITSCNNAFKILDHGRVARWCRNCPKCRFVFLALAPFCDAPRLEAMFGGNLLDDLDQLPGYRDLLGLGEHKPFECVGEEDESLAAIGRLLAEPQWQHRPVVAALREEVRAVPAPSLAQVLGRRAPSAVPADYAWVRDELA